MADTLDQLIAKLKQVKREAQEAEAAFNRAQQAANRPRTRTPFDAEELRGEDRTTSFNAMNQQKVVATKLAQELASVARNAGFSEKRIQALTQDLIGFGDTAKNIDAVGDKFLAQAKRILGVRSEVQKLRMEQQRLLEQQRQTFQTDPRYARARSNLGNALPGGIDPRITIQEESSTRMARVTASWSDSDGTLKKFTQTVDRFGNTVVDTQRRFRSFTDAIRRDIREFIQWSVAAGLVYGTFQKLNELVSTAIDNESKLADVTIALGKTQADTNTIFEDAYKIAQQTGESLNGVIEGYSLAYRAVGNLGSGEEKTITANRLMADSLVLSKLSTLNQAEALDTLVASLKQSNLSLDQGSVLLDKWVRTTQIANVDLASLATGFAIVGDAAEAAGLNADDLNGVLAAIGETGVASGRELANTARAIVASFQSEQGRKALAEIGIAIEDVNGQAKNFKQIFDEISQRRNEGLIDDESIRKLSLALGGGTRRQAAVQTFIDNYQRVEEVAKESATASGEASAALGVKIETVATSVEKLGNSFQKLAQTLGVEGGLLDIISKIADAASFLVDSLSEIIKLTGKATIPALGLAAAFAYTRGHTTGLSKIPQAIANRFSTVSYGLPEGYNQTPYGIRGPGGQFASNPGLVANRQITPFGQFASNPRLLAGAAGFALGGVLPAIGNALEGRMDKAGANLGGAAVGALVGSLAGPAGATIGAAIGSSIGESFVELASQKGADEIAASIMSGVEEWRSSQGTDKKDSTGKTAEQLVNEQIAAVTEQAYKNFGFGNARLGQFRAGLSAGFATLGGQAFGGLKEGQNVEASQIALLSNPELLQQWGELQRPTEERRQQDAEAEKRINELAQSLLPTVIDAVTARTADITDKLNKGQLGRAEWERQTSALAGFKSSFFPSLQQYAGSQGKQITDYSQQELKDIIDTLAEIKQFAPAEVTDRFNVLGDAITSSQDSIDEYNAKLLTLSSTDSEYSKVLNNKIAEEEYLLSLQAQYNTLLAETNRELELAKQLYQREDFGKFSESEFRTLYEAAYKNFSMERSLERDYLPEDEKTQRWFEELTDPEKNKKPILLKFSDSTKIDEFIPQVIEYLNQNLEELKTQTGIMERQGLDLNFMDQYDTGTIQRAASESVRLNELLKKYGYKGEVEDSLVTTSEGTTLIHADMKIMQYLLGKIEENTSKQLEGLYNLPEGASFWFPGSAIPLIKAAGQQGGGLDLSGLEQAIARLENIFGAPEAQATTTVSVEKTVSPTAVEDKLDWQKKAKKAAKEFVNPYPEEMTNKDYQDYQKYMMQASAYNNYANAATGNLKTAPNQLEKGAPMTTTEIPPVQTALDIKATTTVNVQIDGRAAWSAIKVWALKDLINYENGATAATQNVSIA